MHFMRSVANIVGICNFFCEREWDGIIPRLFVNSLIPVTKVISSRFYACVAGAKSEKQRKPLEK